MSSSARAFSARISTITHATEDPGKTVQAIRNLTISESSSGFTTKRAKGHHGNEIVTTVLTIRGAKSAEKFLKVIWSGFSQLDRIEILSSLASRVDPTGTMFLRVDKQEALKRRVRLENADPIKVEISFLIERPKRMELVNNIRRTLEEIREQD